MDSEPSTSSGAGSKRPRNNTNKRRVQKPQQGSSSHEQLNHVAPGASPPGCEADPPASGDESEESSPSRTPRPKGKSKAPRRRKASASPVMIEDIIEGFAIASFKTLEDLEMQTQLDLETNRILTQGYTLTSLPSTPTTPQTVPVSFPATSDTATVGSSGQPSDMDTMVTTATTTTTAATLATDPAVPDTKGSATVLPPTTNTNSSVTPSSTEKGKKEVVKKSKKCASADHTAKSGSKETKVQTSQPTSGKKSSGNSAKSSAKCSVGSNCVKNSKLVDSKAPLLPLTADSPSAQGPPPCSDSGKPANSFDQHLPPGSAELTIKKELNLGTDSKPELSVAANTHSHTHNNNNHKLKSLSPSHNNKDTKPSNLPRENNIIKTERHSIIKHTHLLPPCGLKDGKSPPKELLDSRGVNRPHQIIPEEPLRQNGQSLSSLNSDRSSSRDRLSDAGSSGRGYICDSESEVDSKASDAGSENVFSTNPLKNRDTGLIPPSLHNGSIHPMVPSPINASVHSNPHGVGLGHLKVPAATTSSLTVVTATTTTASLTALTVTTAVTATTATPALANSYCSSSVYMNSASKPQAKLPKPTPVSSSSSSSSSSTAAASTSSSVPPSHGPARSHTPVHREQPRPIPGLSGTRPGDHDHREVTPIRPYSRGPSWHGGSSLPPSQLPHSSPHISPAAGIPPAPSLSIPGLHHPSHAPPGAPLPHHPHQPVAATHPGLPAHSMFAPPLAPPASALTSSALPVHSPLGVDPLTSSLGANHSLLRSHPDRFLDNPLRLPFLSSYHHHQHEHQHMHHYPPGSGLLIPSGSNPQLLDKFAKIESPLYRPGLSSLPGGPLGLSPMLHPPPGLPSAPALGSSLHGAFQPKNGGSSSLHTPMLLPLARDKPQTPSVTPKKSGKWCAAHVRIAWEIHIHQQKHSEGSSRGENKPSDLLRPPSHLLHGAGGLHRPEHGPLGLLGPQSKPSAHTRSPFDSAHPGPHGSLFNPAHLGSSPFPRPSPYPGLSLNSAAFGGLANIGSSLYPGRDLPAMPGITSPHEWNRLHRTPSSFPTPPAVWPPKSDLDREREKERERDREQERERDKDARERERERDKARERDRERSMSRESHHNHREDVNSRERDDLNHRERERDRIIRDKEHDVLMKRSPSRETDRRSFDDRKREANRVMERSRSRSPLRNGPDPHHKSDSPYTRNSPLVRPSDIKVKEEKKDDVMLIEDGKERQPTDFRPQLLNKMDSRNIMLQPPHSSLASLYPDRRHMSPYERSLSGHHPALWNPFERSHLEMNHRSDIEREREQLLRRMNPLSLPVSGGAPLNLLEAEKLQQQLMLRDQERLVAMEREHRERILASTMDLERSKIPPPLRHNAESYHPAFGGSGIPNSSYHPSAASRPPSNSSYHHPSGASRPPSSPVIINHNSNTSSSKSNSPSVVGAPPPLIPSSVTHNHSGGSPTPNKVKPPTPLINSITGLDVPVTKDKIEVNSNGLDTDSQAR